MEAVGKRNARAADQGRAAPRAETLPADDDTRPSGVPVLSAAAPAGFGAALGALGGLALGLMAGGPVGALVGGILGVVGGAGLGDAISKMQEHRELHDERIDEEIGVIGGDLGAAPPDQPPAWIGAYSWGSAGGAGAPVATRPPDEGPIPKAD